MFVEILHTKTSDGVHLDGSLCVPAAGENQLPIDACVMVHGRGGNFHGPGLFEEFAGRLVEQGCPVCRVNTRGARGEVGQVQTNNGRIRVGAACEVVDHCRFDLDAWIGEMVARGYKRIGLWGHSLGAVKSIYYQAKTDDERVALVVAGSPLHLSFDHFLTQPEGAEIGQMYDHCLALMGEGKGDEILVVPGPLRGTLSSASQYVEKFGPDRNYDILRYLPDVKCPLLVTIGTEESRTMVPFRGLYEKIQPIADQYDRLTTYLIDGADHSYTGKRDEVIGVVLDWMASLRE